MLILDSGLVLRRAHLIQTITLDATRVDNFFHDVQRLQWTSSLVLAAGPNTLADGVKSSKRLERLELGNCYFHSLPEQPPVGGWTVHRDIGMGQTYGWWRGWWGWWVHSHISQLGPISGVLQAPEIRPIFTWHQVLEEFGAHRAAHHTVRQHAAISALQD